MANSESMLATCANCGRSFDEEDVNMVDYDIDLCIHCEKEYSKLQHNKKEQNDLVVKCSVCDKDEMESILLEYPLTVRYKGLGTIAAAIEEELCICLNCLEEEYKNAEIEEYN